MPSRSLKKILATHYAFVTALPFVLIIIFSLVLIVPREKADIAQRHRQLALMIDAQLDTFLLNQVAALREISSLDFSTREAQYLLDRAATESTAMQTVYLVSSTGLVKRIGLSRPHENNLRTALEGGDLSRTDIFKKVSLQRKPVWSESFPSIVSGKTAIALAVPAGDMVLIGEISPAELARYLSRISPTPKDLIFLIDQQGQVIADQTSPHTARQNNMNTMELMKRRDAATLPVTNYLTFHGGAYLGTLSTLRSTGWYTFLATPRELALANTYHSGGVILAGLLVALILAALSGKLMLQKLSRQFEAVARHAEQIARQGNTSAWTEGGVQEFDHIAETLQQMSEIITDRESSIMDGLNHIRLDRVRFECLFELSKKAELPEQEIMNYALDAAVKVTDSTSGYLYALNGDETELTLLSWSADVMTAGAAPSPPVRHPVAETGLWGEAVQQRRPVSCNDHAGPALVPENTSENHLRIGRYLGLPVFDQGKIVLLAGVCNKDTPYDDEDIHQLNLLLDATWLLIQKKRSDTLLKESEERSLQLFQQNEDALVFFRLSAMRPIDANPAAFRMFGIEGHDLQRLSPRRIFGRADLVMLFAAIRTPGTGLFFEKVKCRRLDGSAFNVSLKGTLLSLNNEQIFFCSFRDVTTKIRLEEEMKATHAKLIQANKMTSLGLLVSSIAHEINNPNQCIGMNAFIMGRVWRDAAPMLKELHGDDESFLLDGVPFAEMKQTVPLMIAALTESSKKIDSYILQLMNFVRDGKGAMDGEVDVNRAVENAVSILWYHIRSGTERFGTQLSGKQPLAKGNFHQIEQVVINMIANALQALPSTSAAVTVETDLSEDGAEAIIRLRDEGRGMDSATLARLAEPFFSTRQAEGGTGLGVYISTNIIREHQGTIAYDSTPGCGTTVTINLPAAARTTSAEAESA